MADIVILGAGLTGLSAAYHLEKLDCRNYTIFEKKSRPGGLLQSVEKDGFTFDHTGHLLHVNDEHFKNFLSTISSLDHNFFKVTRHSSIFSEGMITPYPYQMNLFGLPMATIIECIEGFINRPQSRKYPTTFYDWTLHHFGKGFARHFFIPYNSKLLAYNIRKITPSWTGRFVPQTDLRSILEGALHQKTVSTVGYNSSFFYPQREGIEFVIKNILPKLHHNVITHHDVEHINLKKRTVTFSNGRTEPYRMLISTLPLNKLIEKIIEPSTSTLFRALPHLVCNSVINLNIGFRNEIPYKQHWIYFPETQYTFYRLGFWHNICPALTPPGHSAVYAETSFLPATTPHAQRQKIAALAKQQLLSFLSLSEQDIRCEEELILDHAYVIYNTWRERHLKKLLATLEEQMIYSIGRFGGWKYSSMQEAVLDGAHIAAQLAPATSTIIPARKNTLTNHQDLIPAERVLKTNP